jgi:hypothetical protein
MPRRRSRYLPPAQLRVGAILLILALVVPLGCGSRDRDFTLFIKDRTTGIGIPGVGVLLAGSDRPLGPSDEDGRVACRLPAEENATIRVRLSRAAGAGGPGYTFADVYEIDPKALEEKTTTFWIEPSASTAVPTDAILVVTSEPAGGSVSLDSVKKGVAPLRLSEIPTGRHLVEVRCPGYEPFASEVVLEGGERELHASLVRSSPSSGPTPPGGPAPTGSPGPTGGPPRDTSPPPASFTHEYLMGTAPGWAEVFINRDPTNRNAAGHFRAALPGGWNTFRVRNVKTGVDVTLRYEVRAGDPNTKLVLDYKRAQVVPNH